MGAAMSYARSQGSQGAAPGSASRDSHLAEVRDRMKDVGLEEIQDFSTSKSEVPEDCVFDLGSLSLSLSLSLTHSLTHSHTNTPHYLRVPQSLIHHHLARELRVLMSRSSCSSCC